MDTGRIKSIVLNMLKEANNRRKFDLYDATVNLAVEAAAQGHSPEAYLRSIFIDRALRSNPEYLSSSVFPACSRHSQREAEDL